MSVSEIPEGRREVEREHDCHICSVERFYSDLRCCTTVSKQNSQAYTLTFDLQQNLPLPHVPVGNVFYLHQLWLYIFGVHSCGTNDVAMYCWPETIAKGSDEVISYLNHFISQLPPTVTTLCLFSDGCGGQNKNVNVMHFLFCLVAQGRFQQIQHTFPVTDHSFLTNDMDLGRTEAEKGRMNVSKHHHNGWM